MNRNAAIGLVFFLGGLAGYIVGVTVAYPGRSFSLTLVMIGISLVVISRGSRGDLA